MKNRFTTVSKWKKDPLGRNLLVNKTINGQPIYRSLSLEKLLKDGIITTNTKKESK